MANVNAERFFDVCDYKDYYDARYDKSLLVKIGNAELHVAEAQWLHEHNQYILTSSRVYQVCHSKNAGYYGICLHWNKGARYTRPGRFHTGDAAWINSIIGTELLSITA